MGTRHLVEVTVGALQSLCKDAQQRLDSQLSEKTESTGTGTLLTLVLRTMQKLPKFAEAKSRQLLPLFLTFVGQTGEDSDSFAVVEGASGKDWKKALTEWLTLLKEMKNARAFYRGALEKEILLDRLFCSFFLTSANQCYMILTQVYTLFFAPA